MISLCNNPSVDLASKIKKIKPFPFDLLRAALQRKGGGGHLTKVFCVEGINLVKKKLYTHTHTMRWG